MDTTDKKVLIAYFSHNGHTAEVAKLIKQKVHGDLFKIDRIVPYPDDYDLCVEQAVHERDTDARPILSGHMKNMDEYDIVFVGYPDWCGSMPMPVFSFLEEYNFAGKTIIPFCTHGGSGFGYSKFEIAKLCPKATVLPGIAIHGSFVNESQEVVEYWLDSITVKG